MVQGDLQGMFNADNCPYIVIGVPAYAPRSEGAVGFALATRRVRALPDSPFSIEDLTAALSRFEAGTARGQLTYAIPADDTLFTGVAPRLSDGSSPMSCEELSGRLATQIDAPDMEPMARLLLRSALEAILRWSWVEADSMLKDCLRISRDEKVRDEALNLLAACLVMSNENERAIQALSKAVEGQWNLRLQGNLAILAIQSDPKLAIGQMAYLIDGAQDSDEKLDAIKMAIGLWRQVQEEELGTDDEESFDPLPDRLIESIVTTLSSSDIQEEDYFDLGMFLARVAPQAVSRSRLRNTSFTGRSTTEIIHARSADFSEYVDNVVRLCRADARRPEVVEIHIDGLVEEVSRGLFDNQTHLAGIAFSFLNQGLGVETMHRVWMRAGLTMLLPQLLDEDGIPNESFIPWIIEAKQAVNSLGMPDDLRDLTMEMLGDAGDMLVHMHMKGFFVHAGEVERIAHGMNQQMTGFFNRLAANKQQIRETALAVVEWCDEQLMMFQSFDQLGIADLGLRTEIEELRVATDSIRRQVRQYL